MNQYAGVVIHKVIREQGTLDVVDGRGFRSLHFDGDAVQSRMQLNNPIRLVVEYTRAMMSCLLFQPEPRNVLLLGLGGGSIAKFLLHHYPDCRIDAVDPHPDMADLAQKYFQLPTDERIHHYIEDGRRFIERHLPDTPYDLILVDAFDQQGLASSINRFDFFQACKRRLSADGVLVLNLWCGQNTGWETTYDYVDVAFEEHILSLRPSQDPENMVLLAFRQSPVSRFSYRQLRQQARELDKATDMGFQQLLKELNFPG